MNFLRTIALSASVLLTGVPQLLADDAKPDGDVLFHDSLESGEEFPEGWTNGPTVPGVTYVYDHKVASDGKRSLSLHKSANRYFPIAAWNRTVDHTWGKPAIQVSANVKTEKITKAILDVIFLDADGEWVSHKWIEYIGPKESGGAPVTHDWKEYKGAAEIPEGTEKLRVSLQIYGPGKVWFDEVEARYVDSVEDAKTSQSGTSAPIAIDETITVSLNETTKGQYLLVPPGEVVAVPKWGFPLLLVLPGGTGSADFHPFVKRIQEQALEGEFLVAQPLAPSLVGRENGIVWPTKHAPLDGDFTTEALVDAVIADVTSKHKINRDYVFLLAWSSGGPAAYATLLQKDSPISGAMIVMSVFKPERLPPLENIGDRCVYIMHSRDDRVCPYWMAEQAYAQLQKAGGTTTLVDYDGGHGWHGQVFAQVDAGIEYLLLDSRERATARQPTFEIP